MKHVLFLLCVLVIGLGCQSTKKSFQPNKWYSLFNGKNLDSWVPKIYHHETGDNFANTYRVVDGTIQVRYDGYTNFDNRYGHLFYKTPFSHYRLKFAYRFTGEWRKDAPSYTILNSGVMFHSQNPYTILKEQDWPVSVEFQMLAGLPDGKPRPTGNMCSPGTDVVFNGQKDPRHCIESTSKTYPPNIWVNCVLEVYGDSLIRHIVEGDTVLTYSKPSVGGGVVNGYDTTLIKPGTPLSSGFIGLQSEGQPVDFKDISIMVLK